MVSKTILIGHLGKAPETRTLEGGKRVTVVSIATKDSYKDGSGEWVNLTDWHDLEAWGYQSDRLGKFDKGDLIYVEGKYKKKEYNDQNGNKVVRSYLKVDFAKKINKE